MPATVSALFRYPVKSFTPEPRDHLAILPGGKVGGDRVLGFRFADAPEADDEWSSKRKMLALVNTACLARLRLHFDEAALRLRVECDGDLLVEDRLDEAGRRRLAEAVAEFALEDEEGAIHGHPEHLPLRLIGDGLTPRYQDSQDGAISLHSIASLSSLGKALGDDLDQSRFRSNIVIDGVEPWEEQAWVGRDLRIGSVSFRVVRASVRCLATHANPQTGVRDLPVLTTLTRAFGQAEPTFAISMHALAPGEISLGDAVDLL